MILVKEIKSTMPDRRARLADAYEIPCPGCGRNLDIPVYTVIGGVGRCPGCGMRLAILWPEEM